jgi:general secretion pathway protein K
MVVILVLGLLIVAVTLASTLALNAGQIEQFQRIAYSREANYQVARSAFELGLALLRVDEADVDGPEDLWASGPTEMTWEGRLLRLEVEDEERRFPINALVPPALPEGAVFEPNEEQDALAKALVRFLDKQGVDGRSAAPALVDWMDPDEVPTAGGSEVSNDPAVPVKNARLDSLHELGFVRHWTSPTGPRPLPLLGGLNADAPQGEAVQGSDATAFEGDAENSTRGANLSQWSDWLSLHSEGKININTAPREVLLSLDEQMTDALVEEIVKKREEGSLSGEEDLRQIATIDEDLLFRLSRLVRYNSQYFRVRIGVSSPPGPIRIEAVVLRDRKNPKVVRWEVY